MYVWGCVCVLCVYGRACCCCCCCWYVCGGCVRVTVYVNVCLCVGDMWVGGGCVRVTMYVNVCLCVGDMWVCGGCVRVTVYVNVCLCVLSTTMLYTTTTQDWWGVWWMCDCDTSQTTPSFSDFSIVTGTAPTSTHTRTLTYPTAKGSLCFFFFFFLLFFLIPSSLSVRLECDENQKIKKTSPNPVPILP